MPVQVAKSKLALKYGAGLGKSVMAHAKDETKRGRMSLPPGIKGGVAKLVSCKFDQYKTGDNAGQYYYQARGMVELPLTFPYMGTDMKTRGLFTMVQIPLYDTKNAKGEVTTQDHYVGLILNEMRLLAGDEFADQITQPPPNLKSDEEKAVWASQKLDDMAAQLEATNKEGEQGIWFNFSTSAKKARQKKVNGKLLFGPDKKPVYEEGDPGIWENWHGSCSYDPSGTPSAADDNSGGIPEASANGTPEPDTAPAGDEPPAEDIDSLSLEELVALASEDTDNGVAATEKLTALALEAGADEAEVKTCDSWEEVAALIVAHQEAAQAEPEPDPAPALAPAPKAGPKPSTPKAAPKAAPAPEPAAWAPKAKEVYYYKVIDKDTGKPEKDARKREKKPIQVSVEAVNVAKQTVKLKNLEDGKTLYPDQPWTALLGEDDK